MTDRFIQNVDTRWVLRDGKKTAIEQAPGVWVLAHRGYSGNGRLDLWAYPSEEAALRAGAQLAKSICGDDPEMQRLIDTDKYREAMARYEQNEPDRHLLRVEPALLIEDA